MALSARDQDLARVIIGSGILRRQRMRRLLLAHLLRESRDEEEEDFGEDEGEEFEEGGDTASVLRLPVAARAMQRAADAPAAARPPGAREAQRG